MDRREFIARTAALAGLPAVLPVGTLIAEAARVQTRRNPLPSPRNMPLDTVVVLMMENRSFDHYFGWFPGADGRNEGLAYPDLEGELHETHRLAPDFKGCGHPDPDHGWDGGRWQWNGGRNDRFFQGSAEGTSDEFAIGYYLEEDVPFIPHAAKAFTLYDRYFCSIMSSTFPNRHYQWGAQAGGVKTNALPVDDMGFQWETIFDRAEKRGVSAGYYFCDLPASGLYGERAKSWTRHIEQFYSDAATGSLPNITFVDPPFGALLGYEPGVSGDEHPHGDIRIGQAFMSDVVHAFMESPQYKRGILFVNYDEWGGFFDHVPPPRVPDQRASRDLAEDWSLMGFRIPAVAVGPAARGGGVKHATLGHESILKLISYRFGLGTLNRRHRYAYNIGRTLDWRDPDPRPPEIPDPVAVAGTPCGAPQEGSERAKAHDMVLLESSGYLERLGWKTEPAHMDRIFRMPDSVKRAL